MSRRAESSLAYLAACALDVCENEAEIEVIEHHRQLVLAAIRKLCPCDARAALNNAGLTEQPSPGEER